LLNSKIIFGLIGVGAVIIILVVGTSFMKPQEPQNNDQYMTKENISSSSSNFTLPVNYTSTDLLNYCSHDESQVYNDICIRGLWEVGDGCKNANFSSSNPICSDPRLGNFEMKVNKEMQDLDRSLLQFVDSCMNVTSENDIGNCSLNIDRIKNDCTDSRYASIMSICNDPNMNKFAEKYADTSSKLKPEQ